MSSAASLPILLKELRLNAFAKNWETLAVKAINEQWSPQEYLSELCDHEISERYHKRLVRMTREAQLPANKNLIDFDYSAIPNIKSTQIDQFIEDISWVERTENILFFGASGVGKTHLAAAIGYALIEKNIRVRFMTATAMVQSLQKAKQELVLADALNKLDKYAVLILDDIGYVKKSDNEASVLFELLAHRYETGSIIITSNQAFSEWDKIFDDNIMTVAAIDRLVHHACILELQAESYRKMQSMKRRDKGMDR